MIKKYKPDYLMSSEDWINYKGQAQDKTIKQNFQMAISAWAVTDDV